MTGRWKWFGAWVLLALALVPVAGCGGDGSGGAPGAPLAPTALQERMLSVADVGTTWKLGPALNEADYGDAGNLPCEDMAMNPTILERLRPVAGVQFEPVDGSSKHLIEFGMTGEPDRLAADLSLFAEGFDACAKEPEAEVEISDLSLPKLGDQRFGYVMTASEVVDGGTATWHVRMATVRLGAAAVHVGLTEILEAGEKPSISDAAFGDLVRKASDALGG